MNWRRGILLAGINLAVAVPLIVMLEVKDETNLREWGARPAQVTDGAATPEGEERTVAFNPCNLWVHYSEQQDMVWFPNLPAAILSGFQQLCPSRWTLAGRLNVGYSWSSSTIPARRKVAWGFGLLVAAQWILVGSFPLSRPKRWWHEPGAFITCCAVIGFGLVLISPVEELARLPASLAALAWLWWFGLLVRECARFGWRLVARKGAATS
jgi:hypothetical protein